ncbi:MAG: hypothetical protein AB1725_01935 [Armatimonadota bacterium]
MTLAFTFTPADVGVILLLILLEGLLSADNALVIALLVRHLPPRQRRNALLVGLVGSFTMRFLAIVLATRLIDFWYIQAVGAIYLLYLPIKHFRARKQESGEKPLPKAGFWKTIALVEFTDLVFAIDSILVAVSLASHYQDESKRIAIIYIGGISGVVLLRVAALVLVRVLERFPGLEHMAYALVAWVGVKLFALAGHSLTLAYDFGWHFPEMPPQLFWGVTVLILLVGVFLSRRAPRRHDSPEVPAQAEAGNEEVSSSERGNE